MEGGSEQHLGKGSELEAVPGARGSGWTPGQSWHVGRPVAAELTSEGRWVVTGQPQHGGSGHHGTHTRRTASTLRLVSSYRPGPGAPLQGEQGGVGSELWPGAPQGAVASGSHQARGRSTRPQGTGAGGQAGSACDSGQRGERATAKHTGAQTCPLGPGSPELGARGCAWSPRLSHTRGSHH